MGKRCQSPFLGKKVSVTFFEKWLLAENTFYVQIFFATTKAPRTFMPNISMKDFLSVAVKKLFGLSYLFPYQRLVISNILEAAEANNIPLRWPSECGEDGEGDGQFAGKGEACTEAQDRESYGRQIVILPTGAGKSLCFQFPAMILSGPTLVLYPILSLMADQQRRLNERGFLPVLLRGGQSEEERQAIWNKIESGEARFIIANPEVLLTPRMLERIKTLGINHVVIDEAHCVSEWGESFRPAYLQIGEIIKACASPLVTAFTATASAPVLEKIEKYIFNSLGGSGARRIIGNPDRSNIRYAAKGCVLRDLAVRDIIIENKLPAIVFCSSRPGTEKLAAWLKSEFRQLKLNPMPEPRFYHAGLSREEKNDVESWFFNNSLGVLVSTCAYGMGVDKADIRTVIHRDCPPSIEAYLQESGRAGRDGAASRATLLWGPDDEKNLQRARENENKNEGNEKRRLAELIAYARDNKTCRRAALLKLLNYEGNSESPKSDCCDVCENQAEESIREEKAIMEFFRKNRLSYTVDEAATILSDAKNIRWSKDQVKQVINEFIKMGKIKTSKNPLWKKKLFTQGPIRH